MMIVHIFLQITYYSKKKNEKKCEKENKIEANKNKVENYHKMIDLRKKNEKKRSQFYD